MWTFLKSAYNLKTVGFISKFVESGKTLNYIAKLILKLGVTKNSGL